MKELRKQVINYVKENKLEVNGLIAAVDLIKIAKQFNTTVLNVMYILRTR